MQKTTSPPAAATPQNTSSRELAVAAIKEALEMIGEADQELDQPRVKQNEKYPSVDGLFLKLIRDWQRARIAPGMLVGLLALVCVVVAVMAWQLKGGPAAPEPIVTSSVPIGKKEELAAKPAAKNSRMAATTLAEPQELRAQLLPQNAPSAAAVAPVPSELAYQIQEMARELANVEQGIGQLKAEQSRMASESAGVAELLKQTHELARHNTELNDNLKATQAQIARDISDLTGQLRANQDLMTILAGQLKENQEQIARLVEQKQRPRPLPPPLPVANLVRRPVPNVPKPPTPTAGTQPRDPAHPQAGQ
jgi:DNA repair exonuclease SbcCD ATPase subunit